jgi:hypothetical protein
MPLPHGLWFFVKRGRLHAACHGRKLVGLFAEFGPPKDIGGKLLSGHGVLSYGLSVDPAETMPDQTR